MSNFEIVMPKLGESIIEATITRWLKKEGDSIKEDESVLEIATDKVDSEIPSPVEGVLLERLFKEGDVVAIGKVIAIIDIGGESEAGNEKSKAEAKVELVEPVKETPELDRWRVGDLKVMEPLMDNLQFGGRFYSPLVKNIAKQENISKLELEHIPGSGNEGRITKQDLLNYLKSRGKAVKIVSSSPPPYSQILSDIPFKSQSREDQIIEMDRIRQLISGHMVRSVQTSPHVTSFVEVDMTRIVIGRLIPEYLGNRFPFVFTKVEYFNILVIINDMPYQVNIP